METDVLGHPVTPTEEELLAGRADLPPCAARNVRKALACLWQVVTDLDLRFEQLYDLGV